MDDGSHHGRGLLVLGFVLALVLGVPFAIWGVRYFSSRSGELSLFILAVLVAFVLLSVLFIVFGRRIFLRFGLRFGERLSSTVTPLVSAIGSSLSGDSSAVGGAVAEVGIKFASWYSWITLRNWIISGTIALLAVFGSLVGIALLEQQNSLLEAQNSLLTTQNEFFRQQIRQQDIQDYHARRAELVRMIFDERVCAKGEKPLPRHTGCPASSVESRAVAAISLYGIEAAARKSPDRESMNVPAVTDLHDIDLRGAHIIGADLRNVRLTGAHLEGAWLESVDLSGADLSFATLGVSDPVEGAASLTKVKLRGAALGHADLRWVTFDADLEQAILQQADLTGADLSPAKHLETADLNDARCCPASSPRGTIWPGSGPHGGFLFSTCIVFESCDTPFPHSQVTWDETTGTRTTRLQGGATPLETADGETPSPEHLP